MAQALKQKPVETTTLDSLCKKLLKTEAPVEFEWNGHKFALISKEDLEHYEDLEDADDVRAANAVLEEMKAKGEEPVPWEDVKEKYGFQE